MRAVITIATTITTENGTEVITSRSRQGSTGMSTLMFADKPAIFKTPLLTRTIPGHFIYIFGVKSSDFANFQKNISPPAFLLPDAGHQPAQGQPGGPFSSPA